MINPYKKAQKHKAPPVPQWLQNARKKSKNESGSLSKKIIKSHLNLTRVAYPIDNDAKFITIIPEQKVTKQFFTAGPTQLESLISADWPAFQSLDRGYTVPVDFINHKQKCIFEQKRFKCKLIPTLDFGNEKPQAYVLTYTAQKNALKAGLTINGQKYLGYYLCVFTWAEQNTNNKGKLYWTYKLRADAVNQRFVQHPNTTKINWVLKHGDDQLTQVINKDHEQR